MRCNLFKRNINISVVTNDGFCEVNYGVAVLGLGVC